MRVRFAARGVLKSPIGHVLPCRTPLGPPTMAVCRSDLQVSRMALREFSDSAGRLWTVWSTHPTKVDSSGSSALGRFMDALPREISSQPLGVRTAYAAGWLTFRTESDTRRLAPIPDDWEAASEERLRRYLLSAQAITPVERRHGS